MQKTDARRVLVGAPIASTPQCPERASAAHAARIRAAARGAPSGVVILGGPVLSPRGETA